MFSEVLRLVAYELGARNNKTTSPTIGIRRTFWFNGVAVITEVDSVSNTGAESIILALMP